MGGAAAFPDCVAEDDLIRRYLEYVDLQAKQGWGQLSVAEQARLEALDGVELARALDSVQILPVQERDADGASRRRLYVAGGSGGVARLNLDDANGMQLLSQVLDDSIWRHVGAIAKAGHTVFAARAHIDWEELPVTVPSPCERLLTQPVSRRTVERISYLVPEDPVYIGELTDGDDRAIKGGNVVHLDGEWLYAAGQRQASYWNPTEPCSFIRLLSASSPAVDASDTVQAVNIYDRARHQEYLVDANVQDLVTYGDYLIVAVGRHGIQILHRELKTRVAELSFDQDLQANPVRAVKLQRMANLLLVSAAQGGVIAVDLADPRQPAILSAGNVEAIEAVDVFKDRLVAVAADAGIAAFELPGAFVQQTGVAEGGYLTAGEDYAVTFNEWVELADDDVTVTNLETGEPVTPRVITLKARQQLDGSGEDLWDPGSGPSDRFAVRFDRIPEAAYEIRILAAVNQRGGGLWLPFVGRVKAASANARRPAIRYVEGGGLLGGQYQDVVIHGSGFSDADTLRVYIDHYELTPQWVDAQTLRLKGTGDPANPADSSIDHLPLAAGEHHLRVVDHELSAGYPGAIVIVEDPQQVHFQLSPESADIHGNRYVTIKANRPAILPGARVVMRSRAGEEIRTAHTPEGIAIFDLKDDVRDLQTLRFWLPPVDQADIYTVALAMGGREVDVGHFSYSPGAGRTIDLPNYPPMKIGALQSRGNLLFVGVKGGRKPTADNRFLMPTGLEIYDIAIGDRPVRLAQIQTAQAVTGVAVFDNAAYLAAGSDGLILVDIANPHRPQIIGNFGLPGNQATDVALNRKTMVLAAAAADAAGGGFIRFYDVADPELDPPAGFSTLDLSSGDAAGRPVDIAWFDDRLFVLLNRGGQLYLAIFDQFDGTRAPTVQVIERGGAAGDLTDASLAVQYDQVVVFTGTEYLILRPTEAETYRVDYWQSAEDSAAALVHRRGGLLMSVAQGLTDVQAPDLAVSSIQPPFGADLAPGETISIWFNQPINTDAEFLAPRVQLWIDPTTTLAPENYTLEAENYLAGAVVRLTLGTELDGVDGLILTVAETITSYQGLRGLAAAVQGDYAILAGRRPTIQRVSRLMDQTPGLNYFHGDASEVAVVAGADFGERKADLQIYVGDHAVPGDSILAVADNEIRFQMPDLNLGLTATMLSLRVVRNAVPAVLNGAMVIQPPVILQALDPPMGPPQGGNKVSLYGLGFSHDIIVRFGDVMAGDLRVRSSSHVEVRAPAGSFGFVAVSVESRFFPDEKSSRTDAYFYAGRETGNVELAGEGLNSSPVAAIAVKDQVLYAVTGGSYDPVDREGRPLATQTATTGRLVLSDISDPVHPTIIYKELAGAWQPFHDEQSHGFRDITLAGADLLAVGSTKLYHYDVTLAADPLRLAHYSLPGQAYGVAVSDGLVYVSTSAGIQVYRLMPDRSLRHTALITAGSLGGQPGHLKVVRDNLWVTLPQNAKVVALDLMAGNFALNHEVAAVDVNGNPYQPVFFSVRDDLLLISSGPAGTVVAYAIRPDQDSYPVAQVPLAYLIANGDVHAGAMLHQGQTLYVATGDGDIQLFDISAWLDGNFREPVTLQKYFAVPGAVRSIALSRGVMYAGSAYVYVDGQPAENPLEVGAEPTSAGGALSTLTDGGLSILEQIPPPRGWLTRDQAIEIQFNRILDQGQFDELAESLFSVQRSGVPVAVYPSHQINARGSRIFMRPVTPWLDQAEYSVLISAAVADIHGNILGRSYRFRCEAADGVMTRIDRIEPPLGSWRGGAEITIYGANFNESSRVEIGGLAVAGPEVHNPSQTRLVFTLPRLEPMPIENRSVGIAVSNGPLRAFRAGQFTYVADPRIDAIGRYEPATNAFQSNQDRLRFNAGEYAALEGPGLSALTKISINNHPAEDVFVIDARRIGFRVPDDTVGALTVRVSNLAHGAAADTVSSDELGIELVPTRQAANTAQLHARRGELMMLGQELSGSAKVRLYTTGDGPSPVLLTTIDLGGALHAMAMSEGYAVFSVGSRHDLVVYDISDLYAPREVNRLFNPAGQTNERLLLAGDTFVSLTAAAVLQGNVHAAGWQSLAFGDIGTVHDIATDGAFLYLLQDTRVTVWRLAELAPVDVSHAHSLLEPRQLEIDQQHLVIWGKDAALTPRLLVLATGGLAVTAQLEALGSIAIGEPLGLAANGELLALAQRQDGAVRLTIYDINTLNHELALDAIVRVQGSVNNLQQLDFNADLLEWIVKTNYYNRSDYYNLRVPLLNTHGLVPARTITAAHQIIAMQTAGLPAAWDQVVLDVAPWAAPDESLVGATHLVGRELQFQTAVDAYAPDSLYRIKLFIPPQPLVDGGAIAYDLPWYLQGASYFGREQLAVDRLLPGMTVAGRPTRFVLQGARLDLSQTLMLNDVAIDSADWTVSHDGTSLAFETDMPDAGVHTLKLSSSDQTVYLAAALVVSEPLAVSAVTTSLGADRVSDAGQTEVLIDGTGLRDHLQVYWFEADQGFEPNAGNIIDGASTAGGTLRFASPPAEAGKQYQIVVRKPGTGEEIRVDARLTAADDTPPVLIGDQGLDYNRPLTLKFSEPVTGANFAASLRFLEYQARPEQDVTDKFELMGEGSRTITIRPRYNESLQHNREYRLRVFGVHDLQGNPAAASWEFSHIFRTNDTLAPRNLDLVRQPDLASVSGSMQLIRGRSYTFVPLAIDNTSSPGQLAYQRRISTDAGLSFGPPQNTSLSGFTLQTAQADQDIVIRLQVLDPAGNPAEKEFTIAVVDPQITLSALYTEPPVVQESTTADICFDATGDIDLLASAAMEILGRNYGAQIIQKDASTQKIVLHYANPALDQLADGQVTVIARLAVNGRRDPVTAAGSYPLAADTRAPTLMIVSPPDGSAVPVGENTTILLQAYDAFGLQQVTVSENGAAARQLPHPDRYEFIPANTDPVTLTFEAVDLNGNQKTAAITLQPYDKAAEKPALALLAPTDGAVFHGGQTITVAVEMHQVDQATLSMDIGGDPSNPHNPVPMALVRGPEDPARFDRAVRLPAVSENVVVILRLEAQGLQARRFINVVADGGIDESLTIALKPATTILGGTDLWIAADVPPGMDDYSDQSTVTVADSGREPRYLAPGSGAHWIDISPAGDAVRIEGILQDRSDHTRSTQRTVTKTAHFTDTVATVDQAPDGAAAIGDMAVVPGLTPAGAELIWVVNQHEGANAQSDAYELRNAAGRVIDQGSGWLAQLEFTGSGLVARHKPASPANLDASHHLVYWPLEDGALGPAVTRPLYGESLGGSGNVLFTRHGDLLDGYVFINGEFVPLAGRSVSDEIRMTAVDADRLFVLTANGVYAFRAEIGDLPALEQLFYTALPPAQGLHVTADLLVTWTGSTLERYRMLDGYDLVALGPIETGGEIIRALADGELLWLLVDDGQSGLIWQAYRDSELVALHRNQADRIVFAGNTAYERIAADGTAGIIRSRGLAAAVQNTAFEPALVETPLGVVIRDAAASATLGAESYTFFDQDGLIRLAAQPIWRNMQRQWFLPRRQLPAGGIQVVRTDRGGHSDSVTLVRSTAEFKDIQQTTPAADTDLTKGARVPLILHLDPAARFEDLALEFDGQEKPVIAGPTAQVYQWLDVPDPAGEAWLTLNAVAPGGASGPYNFNLKDNQPGLEIVKILQPSSNQSFTEGSRLTVEFSASRDSGQPFQYAEISLYDTQPDSLPLEGRLVTAPQGRAALQLPLLDEWQNFSVRVRGYYGSDFNYSESVVNIKVFPSLEQTPLEISTGGPRVMQGSQFSADIRTPVPAGGSTWLEIRDDQDNPLAAGDTHAGLTVPPGVPALQVTAHVSDGRGNTSQQTLSIEVIEALGLAAAPEAEFRRFDAALAAVGNAWFVRDRGLYDLADRHLATLEAPITALGHLGHRLVLALANTGLAVVQPSDSTGGGLRELSLLPVSGSITRLAVADNGLLAVIDGQVYGFHVSGNAIADPTPIPISGRVLDIQVRTDHFIVLSDTEVQMIDANFGAIKQLAGSFDALAQTCDFIFVTARDGRLHSLRDDWSRQSFDLGIRAERLMVLQGDLLALTSGRDAGSGSIQVIDIRHPLQPEVTGRFAWDFDDDLSQAVLAGGRIWLGGSRGMVLELQPASHEPVLRYRSRQARGSIPDVAIARDRYLAAANDLGAIILGRDPSGTWNETVYPAAYTHGTRAVSAANESAYLMQTDSRRVTALNGRGSEKFIFSGQPFEHLASTRSEIMAAAADHLLIAPSTGSGSHDIALGQLIEALATAGDSLLVSTQDQHVRQLDLKKLPVGLWRDDSREIEGIAGTEPVRLMASDGDHLYYAHDNRLYRLPLLGADGDVPVEDQTTLGQTIEALAFGSGSLWVGDANHIYRLPTDTALSQLPPDQFNTPFLTIPCRFATTCEVTALAVERDHLLIGLGADGLALYQLPALPAGTSPSLYAPTAGTIYAPNQEITLQLNETAGVNAVRYRINGQIAAQRNHAPFAAKIRVPTGILNGQTFEIVSEIETVWGTVRMSEPRRVKLLGDPAPGLDFEIDLAVDGHYLTRPVRLGATVTGAAYPVAQVGFYYSAAATGPWELIDTLYGPEYVIGRDFDSQAHGHYLKARAVDVYGFYKDSAVKQINRLPDTAAPQAPVFSIEGDLKAGRPLAGRPFTVNVTCIDLESGIAQALLYLDGKMVDARFDDGNLGHAVLLPATGASYDFTVTLRDHAGHEISGAATYTVYEDAPPSKPTIAADNPIRERSQFNVAVSADDDLGVKNARVAWHGQILEKMFGGSNTSEQFAFTIRDDRGERLTAAIAEPLTVTVTDSADQTSSETVIVAVRPDTPPDATLLGIQVPARAFYDSNLPIDIYNLAASDDGGYEDLNLVIENRITGRKIELAGQPTIQTTLKTPATKVSNDEFPLTVSLVDGLGQASQGIELEVPLYHIPNLIRFEAAGNSGLNPDSAAVGETVTLQVQVLDSAWQPIPGQTVEWRIETGPDLANVLLETTTSDTDGLASLVFSTQRRAGTYRIRAALTEIATIQSVHQLAMLPGPPDHIEISYVPPVAAAEIVTFRLQAVDAVHNPVPALENENVILQIADLGFHFEFAENVTIGDLLAGETVVGEQAMIELVNGRAEVQASTTEIAGSYHAEVAFEAGSPLFARYDADDDPLTEPVAASRIPLTVMPGPPAVLRLEQIAMTNHDLGDPDILEITETATLQLRLEDDYGNRVRTVADGDGGRRDTDFTVELTVSGSAYSGYRDVPAGTLIVHADGMHATTLADQGLSAFEIAPGEFMVVFDFARYAALFGQNTVPADLITPLQRYFSEPIAVFSVGQPLTVTYASGADAHAGGGCYAGINWQAATDMAANVYFNNYKWYGGYYGPNTVQDTFNGVYIFDNPRASEHTGTDSATWLSGIYRAVTDEIHATLNYGAACLTALTLDDANHPSPFNGYCESGSTRTFTIPSVDDLDQFGSLVVQMRQGNASFPVSDDTVEAVNISITEVTPQLPGVDTLPAITLDFAKKVPAIQQAAFDVAHNDVNPPIVFIYSEPIGNAGAADPLAVTLDDQPVAGTFEVAGSQVTYRPAQAVELNRCYAYDTGISSWVGAAEQDAVLQQQGFVCSPQVAIPMQPVDYALEAGPSSLNLVFGPEVQSADISNGKITLHGIESQFNWIDATFVMPSFQGLGLEDGSSVTLALSGRYQDDPLRVANTTTVRILLRGDTYDYDRDGLSNELEARLNLNPTTTDTDGNDIADRDEDSDGDGFTNAEELALGTDPGNYDTTAPTVAAVTPAPNAAAAALLPKVEIVFSESIEPRTVSSQSLSISGRGVAVGGRITFSENNARAIWQAEEGLAPGAIYEVRLSNEIRDTAGNRLIPYTSSFTATDLAIILPPDNSQVIEGQPIEIRAGGSNLAGINTIEFFVDGTSAGSADSDPFGLPYSVPLLAELPDDTLAITAEAVIGGTNLARTAALAASALTYDHAFHPDRAADGNPDPDFKKGSIAVVMGQPHAWWQADLGRLKRIEEINIHLMDGCCYQSNQFLVLAAGTPFVEADFAGSVLPDSFSNDAVEVYRTAAEYDTGVVSIPGIFRGRYVRVVNLADDFLSLAEVQIIEERIAIPIPAIQVRVDPQP